MAYSPSSQRRVRLLSFLHVGVAVLCLILSVCQISAVHHWSSYTGSGIWGGFWIFIIGLIGYFSVKDRENNQGKTCLIGTQMALAIVGSVLSVIVVITLSFALVDLYDCIDCYENESREYHYFKDDVRFRDNATHPHTIYVPTCRSYHSITTGPECHTGVSLVWCQVLLQCLEFFLAITSAAFCCSAVCCGTPSQNQQVIYVPTEQGLVQIQGVAFTGGQPGQIVQVPPQYYPAQQYSGPPPFSALPSGPPIDEAGAIGTTAPSDRQAGPLPQKN